MIKLILLSFGIFFYIFTHTFSYASTTATASATTDKQNILIIGDSISAGYGLRPKESWVDLLQNRIDDKQYPYHVINASLSGDTTGGAIKRFQKSLLQHQPKIVLIELGANDGLRGLSLKKMKQNLSDMIDLCLKNKQTVVLIGMQLPPNYGPAYTKRFASTYQSLASEKNVALVPFMFEGFADNLRYFQRDQIHPNAEAQMLLLDNVWPALVPLMLH